MSSAQRFKQNKLPRQPGEAARLKVAKGPEQGVVFVITGRRATIGRGEDNDMIIADLKSSRRHAEIILQPNGEWRAKDLGSANGIILNGQVTRDGVLRNGDLLAVGETAMEFLTESAGTKLLLAAPVSELSSSPSPAAAFGLPSSFASPFAKAAPSLAASAPAGFKPSPLMIGVGALGLVALFIDSGTSTPTAKKSVSRDLATYLPAYDIGSGIPAAETFFKAGFREYREKNYLRAKLQFETVLQIAPGHSLATIYLRNAEKEIDDEVKAHLDQGRKTLGVGRFNTARAHFEAVLRLLARDQGNPSFIEAKEQLEKTTKMMKGGPTSS